MNGNIFEDDDLDAAVGAADDTGMVTSQQIIIKTELDEDDARGTEEKTRD